MSRMVRITRVWRSNTTIADIEIDSDDPDDLAAIAAEEFGRSASVRNVSLTHEPGWGWVATIGGSGQPRIWVRYIDNGSMR